MRARPAKCIAAAAWLVMLMAAAVPAAHGQAVSGTDPTETTIVAGSAAGVPSALDGAWQVGTGAGAVTFRIDGRVMAGRTPCGPFTAALVSRPGGTGAMVLSMPDNCPGRFRRDQLLFRVNLQGAANLAVVDGRLEARDQAGVILFTGARIEPAAVPVGAADRLDGTWSTTRARPRGGSAVPAPVLRIRRNQLTITGACNEYAGTLTTGPVIGDAYESRILISSAAQGLCAQRVAEQVDAELLRTLESVRWIRVANNRLELRAARQQTVLTLVRL